MDRTLFHTLVQPFCFCLLHLSAARANHAEIHRTHGTAAGFPLCGSATDFSEAAETSHYLKQRRCTMSQRHPFARCRCRRFGRDSQPTYVCTSGALRWPSRCLLLAPLSSSRMVTCTASRTPHNAQFRACTRQRVRGRCAPNSGLAHPNCGQVLAPSTTAF